MCAVFKATPYELCTNPREVCVVLGEGDMGHTSQGGLWCWQQREVDGARCDSFKMAMCCWQVMCHGLRKVGAEWSGVYCRALSKMRFASWCLFLLLVSVLPIKI